MSIVPPDTVSLCQVVSAPPGAQAVTLDIERAYCNSLLSPRHKPYVAVIWRDMIWGEHCTILSLASSGGIQGLPADTVVAILKTKGIEHVIKWVNDFAFICMPIQLLSPDATQSSVLT